MAELTKEQLIELITREVLKTLGGGEPEEPADKSGLPLALCIGPADQLPRGVRSQYRFASIEEYQGDIAPYERVFITAITQTQLVDTALGRDSQPVTCALSNALLQGKEIFLYDSALGHRKLAGRGSRGFYQLLEGYVRTLQSYGVKLVQGTTVIDKYQKTAAPGADLPSGVITEAVALELCRKGEGEIVLRKGTVLTPSAKDVFLHANRHITYL